MQSYLQQSWGIIAKDLRQSQRDWQASLGPLILPLVLLVLAALLFGSGGDAWPIGLVVESESPVAQELVRVIETAHSNISPYYQIITRDREEARRLVAQGRLHMVITIPADFGVRLAAGQTPVIETEVFNINTDMTKNIRLRLDHVIQQFAAAQGKAPVVIDQLTTRPEDVWRRAFLAGSAFILALMVGGALNTAIVIAREWERNTHKEVRLAPRVTAALVTGKLSAGLLVTLVNVLVTLVVAVGLFGLRVPPERWLPLAGLSLGVTVASAGLGLGLGALLQDYRAIQPLILVTAAGSFFVAGGFTSVATMPPAIRFFNRFWPPAYVFETMQRVMHGAVLPDLSQAWLVLPLIAAVSVAFGAWALRRVL